ncbi:ATP-binding protein [Streptacidiphilus sp. N1-3]|uniref:ATP-binding protein n=1 Tax=Streptacidiphilus alkalitolerans TaxID=3342712 RepID=A0ABV6XBG4_9ACTN
MTLVGRWWTVTACRGNVPFVRSQVRGAVSRLAAPPARAQIGDLELLCSELVANAIQHTDSRTVDVRLVVLGEGFERRVRLDVQDDSSDVPVVRDADGRASGGRGMCLVAEFTNSCWGVERLPRGKRVWAELAVPTAAAVVLAPAAPTVSACGTLRLETRQAGERRGQGGAIRPHRSTRVMPLLESA